MVLPKPVEQRSESRAVSLTIGLWDRIDEAAIKAGLNRSAFVRQCMEHELVRQQIEWDLREAEGECASGYLG